MTIHEAKVVKQKLIEELNKNYSRYPCTIALCFDKNNRLAIKVVFEKYNNINWTPNYMGLPLIVEWKYHGL